MVDEKLKSLPDRIGFLVVIAYSIKVLINGQSKNVDYQLNWMLAFLLNPLLAIPYYTYLQVRGKAAI